MQQIHPNPRDKTKIFFWPKPKSRINKRTIQILPIDIVLSPISPFLSHKGNLNIIYSPQRANCYFVNCGIASSNERCRARRKKNDDSAIEREDEISVFCRRCRSGAVGASIDVRVPRVFVALADPLIRDSLVYIDAHSRLDSPNPSISFTLDFTSIGSALYSPIFIVSALALQRPAHSN